MGIDNYSVIICGTKIDLSSKILDNISSYDPTFVRLDDVAYYHELRYVLTNISDWLRKNHPNLTVNYANPSFDCGYEYTCFFLTFTSLYITSGSKISLADMVTRLNSIDIEEFETVFKILFPDVKYSPPMIQTLPNIW